MTRAFGGATRELGPGKKVLFPGSEAVCLPFAELPAYACRDLGHSFYFAPGGKAGEGGGAEVQVAPRLSDRQEAQAG